MEWPEALEIVVERTKHERYRWLCSDDNPEHETYRAMVMRKALDEPEPPPFVPPALTEQELKDVLGCCGGGPLPP